MAAIFLSLLLLVPETDEPGWICTLVVAVSLFFVAFFCAFPYYLVPNLFAFDMMGTECATLIGFFELTSFSSMMPAHMLLLRIAGTYGWSYALVQMAITMSFAALFLSLLLPKWRAIRDRAQGAPVEDGHVSGYRQLRPAPEGPMPKASQS
mmetsp:Transcript_16934/g.29300  ORF Transcript_16934/g.29300 Transcript_16934/m.29300 type:complete len:151 (+) Transcript_16934:2-454(+)